MHTAFVVQKVIEETSTLLLVVMRVEIELERRRQRNETEVEKRDEGREVESRYRLRAGNER